MSISKMLYVVYALLPADLFRLELASVARRLLAGRFYVAHYLVPSHPFFIVVRLGS